jgi:hypothetical protein
LTQIGLETVLVLDEGLPVVQHILVWRFLHAVDLKPAVVGVFGGLEVLDPFEEGLFFLGGEGVAHGIP